MIYDLIKEQFNKNPGSELPVEDNPHRTMI